MAAKRKGGNSFSVSVEGLSKLASLPGWLDQGQREFLKRGSEGIRDEIRRKAPGGPGSKFALDVVSRTLSPTTAFVGSRGLPAARAMNRGAYIRSKRGEATAIRFDVNGRTVFVRSPRGVRIKGRRYFEKGLRARGRIIRAAYLQAFGDLEKHAGGVAGA